MIEFGAKYRDEWKKAGANLRKKFIESVNEAPLDGVHQDKKDWIESGDEIINKIMPELSPEEQKYLKTIASESYEETVNRVEEYTGIRVEPGNFPSLFSLLMQTLERTKTIESTNKRYLEELALSLVFSVPEFKIVEEAYLNDELGFDIKLAAAELDRITQEEPEEGLSQSEEINLELADDWGDISEESLRRKFSNMLISGGSINKLYLFNMAVEKLERIDENLPKYYGILSSMAQIGYWLTPFNIEQEAAAGEDTAAGSEEVVPEGDKYVIKVRGITFPFLVHELVKGIYEYLALDPDHQIAMQDDKLEDETKDMMAGPGVYKAVTSYLPADKQEILPIVQKKLTGLSVEDIRNVIAKNSAGQSIMRDLIADADKEWSAYKKEKEDYRSFESTGISEGVRRARELYVDTEQMTKRQLSMLTAKDPTPQKKYIEWIARTYLAGHRNIRQYGELAEFDDLCNRGTIEQKDINKYASMEDVTDAVVRAQREMGEKEEKAKEKKTRTALTDYEGSVGRVRKILKGIPIEYIQQVRNKMAREEQGIFGDDEPVPVDEGIFKLIDPDDIVRDNEYMTMVKAESLEKAQLYGRNHLYDPKDSKSIDCPWCIGYTTRSNMWKTYYGTNGDSFYIILPKASEYVPDKLYYKIIIEAKANYKGGVRIVWNYTDVQMDEAAIAKLFDFWEIPWAGKDGKQEERSY